MSKMADYARIFGIESNDDWVEKRIKAVRDVASTYRDYSPQQAIQVASILAASLQEGAMLPPVVASPAEKIIQHHASSFVRTSERDDLQIKVVMLAAAIDFLDDAPIQVGWTAADALAASLWSAFAFQSPLVESKVEALRRDVIVASRGRTLKVADVGRKRQPIPGIGSVNIAQDSAPGAKVNQAFARAVEPMLNTLTNNAALDREELDFMWWLMADRCECLDEPFSSMPETVRAVASGFDAAAKLRRLPADAHRHIVLRNVPEGGEGLALPALLDLLGERKHKLAASFDSLVRESPMVFPLASALSAQGHDVPFGGVLRTAREWGERALLEGAIFFLNADHTGGL